MWRLDVLLFAAVAHHYRHASVPPWSPAFVPWQGAWVRARKGVTGWHGAEEEAASGEASPSLCAGDAGVDVLGGDALLGAAKRLNDGVFVEVLHTACIVHESVHRDVRPEPLDEPSDDRDGKEEV